MAKTLLQEIKGFGRTAAKASLYVAGGYTMAQPLFNAAWSYMNGVPLSFALNQMVKEASGFDPVVGKIEAGRVQGAAFRYIAGGAMLYAAHKIK